MMQQSQAAQAQIEADRQRMTADTPQTTFLRSLAQRGADWINGGDYRKPAPGMFSVNLSDPEARAKEREATLNLTPTGAYALGMRYANPTALAMSRQVLNDELDRDNAQNYEKQVNDYMGDVVNLNSNLSNFDFSKNQALLGNATSRWQYASGQWGDTARARGQVAPAIIGGVLGAAGNILAARAGRG